MAGWRGKGKGRNELERLEPKIIWLVLRFRGSIGGGLILLGKTHHVELILGSTSGPGSSLGSALIPLWVVRVQPVRVGYRGQGRTEVTPRREWGGVVHVGYFMRCERGKGTAAST